MFLNKTASLCVLSALVLSVAPSQAAAVPAQSELEAIYYTWRQSMMRADYALWRSTTAMFRQRTVRNQAVSEKKPFPKALFTLEMQPPALTGLKFVGIKTAGDTAAATYYGKVDFGVGGSPSDNAFVLLFVRENGSWKYDTARYFNLSKLPEVRRRLARGDTKILEEQDGFKPLGKTPFVPPLCPQPKFIAKLYIDCPGRKVVANVNNVSFHTFENTREAVLVSGGLKGGMNTINYQIEDMPDVPKGHFVISVFIMPEVPGNIPGKAFQYYTKATEVPTGGDFMMNVDLNLLKTMKAPEPAPAPKKPSKQ